MNTVMGVRNWLNDMEAKQNQTPEKNPRSKIELDMPMSKVTPLRVWLQEIERQNRENAERFKTKCSHNHRELMSTHQLGYRQLRLKNKVREITNWLEQIEQNDSEKVCKDQTQMIDLNDLLTTHDLLKSDNVHNIANDSVAKGFQEDSKFTTTILPNNSLENLLLNDDISEGSSVIDYLMSVNNVSDNVQEYTHLNKDSDAYLTKRTGGVILEKDNTLSIIKHQMLISQVDNIRGKEIENTVISHPKSLLQKQVSFISLGEKKPYMISTPKGSVKLINTNAKILKKLGSISKLFKRFRKLFKRKSKEKSINIKTLDLQDKCLTKPFNPNDSDYAKLLDNDVVCQKKSSDISKLNISCTDSTVFVPSTVLQEQSERNYLPAWYEKQEKNEQDQAMSYRNNESPQSLAAAFEQGMSPVHSTASTVDFSFYGDSLIPNNYSCNNVSQHVGWLKDMFATPTKSKEKRVGQIRKMY